MATPKTQLDPRPALAKKVRWMRQQAGWSQAEAAEQIGVSRETFNRWETGALVIPPAKLHKLKHLAHVVLADYKPPLIYDADGFPAPFTRAKYAEAEEASFDAGIDNPLDVELSRVEGDEFVERQIHRDYLEYANQTRRFQVTPKKKAAFIREELPAQNVRYYEDLAQKALG